MEELGMTYKLGITGGIATGKTTVANDFRAAGTP
ncbi:dephospho-CoA kinase [Lacticaseibacillus pantheris]|nr:dephospho-CoA kinase [Lacticaseibacillus pantheris]